MFISDFGETPEQLFASFNPTPIAAASLAQVFKAITYEGQGMVIYYTIKNILCSYRGDMYILKVSLSCFNLY